MTRLRDLTWFTDALAASREEMVRVPTEFWPPWFRKYYPEADWNEHQAELKRQLSASALPEEDK